MTEDIKINEFHCCFCGHIFENLEDSGTHECLGVKKSNEECWIRNYALNSLV